MWSKLCELYSTLKQFIEEELTKHPDPDYRQSIYRKLSGKVNPEFFERVLNSNLSPDYPDLECGKPVPTDFPDPESAMLNMV